MKRLYMLSGILLITAGLLLLFLNIVFTPKVMAIDSYTEGARTNAYAWRLGMASLTALVSIIASTGIYAIYHNKHPNTLGGIILLISLVIGNAMLLAHEWNQFLFIRELAISFPGTLDELNELEGFSLYDLSATVSVSLYFLGWLISAIILWVGKVIKPYTALFIIGGLIASPVLAAFLPIVYAGIIASLLLAAGWFLLASKLISAT